MYVSVNVGSTVVGAFHSTTSRAFIRCIRAVSPGCKPTIKKGYHPHRVVAKKCCRETARQQTNRVGSYEKITYLKPGDFRL